MDTEKIFLWQLEGVKVIYNFFFHWSEVCAGADCDFNSSKLVIYKKNSC